MTILSEASFSRKVRHRVFLGDHSNLFRRVSRYVFVLSVVLGGLWVPIFLYVSLADPQYESHVSLILPGAGAKSQVNLNDIGQASSSSDYRLTSTISPMVTYKKLLNANRVLEKAASSLNETIGEFGKPQIKLVDETAFIEYSILGSSPEHAQNKANALLNSFLSELENLRVDEKTTREVSAQGAIELYQNQVQILRDEIGKVQRESGLLSWKHYVEKTTRKDQLAQELEIARRDMKEIDAQLSKFAATLNISSEMASLYLKLQSDNMFKELSQLYSESLSSLANLDQNFGTQHPKRINSTLQYDSAKLAVLKRINELGGSLQDQGEILLLLQEQSMHLEMYADLIRLDSKKQSTEARLKQVEEDYNTLNEALISLTDSATKLEDLERDYKIAEAVFASALARTDASKSESYGSYPLVQVLEDATLPSKQKSPDTIIAIISGILGSIMAIISLALLWVRSSIFRKFFK